MDKWSKEEKTELCKFWQSEVGKKYVKRMEDTKKELLQASMGSKEPNDAFRFSAIANGFDSIIQDIEALLKAEEDKKEKEGATKKK